MTDTERVIVNFTPAGNPVTHGGSGTAYANYGCRCNPCTQANRVRTQRRRLERLPDEAPRGSHGTVSTYNNWNCRCGDCLRAKSDENRESAAQRGERWALN